MSKIGKKPIIIPSGVTVAVTGNEVAVVGSKGQLKLTIPAHIEVVVADNEVAITAKKASNEVNAMHGLIRSLLNNMVTGVHTGYTRRLQLVGTGYRVARKGAGLTISVGYSHPVEVAAQAGIQLDIEGNNIIIVTGIDKHLVGQVAANIRRIRPPEPYKGKGIRYEDEVVRRKQGKAVAK